MSITDTEHQPGPDLSAARPAGPVPDGEPPAPKGFAQPTEAEVRRVLAEAVGLLTVRGVMTAVAEQRARDAGAKRLADWTYHVAGAPPQHTAKILGNLVDNAVIAVLRVRDSAHLDTTTSRSAIWGSTPNTRLYARGNLVLDLARRRQATLDEAQAVRAEGQHAANAIRDALDRVITGQFLCSVDAHGKVVLTLSPEQTIRLAAKLDRWS
jgi:hypothetical protein